MKTRAIIEVVHAYGVIISAGDSMNGYVFNHREMLPPNIKEGDVLDIEITINNEASDRRRKEVM